MRIMLAIRFIMNNNGISLVETVIATAILGVIAIPLLAGFSQAFKNYNTSYQYYMASVEVGNIMIDISTALSSGVDTSELSAPNACHVEGFQYAVHIGRVLGDNLYEWASYTNGDIFPLPDITLRSDRFSHTADGYILVVDIYRGDDVLIKRVVQPVWV